MAGLGDLLGTLLGGQKAGGDEAQSAGILARVAISVGDTLSKIPGSPFQLADWGLKAKTLADNREGVLSALSEGDAGKVLQASHVLSDEAAKSTIDNVNAIADVIKGRTAQAQLEALIGVPIPASATTTKAVMEQLALLTQVNEAIQGVSVAAEVASLGQIDQVGPELRSYLDYSGVSQISGFGYGQILGTVIGARMSQEMLQATRPSIPSVLDLATMRMREHITAEDYASNMGRLGYPDDMSENLYATSRFYPGPQDWIRFAVRDAFNPDVVASAGLDEQFPADIVPYAEKGGVSEEHMRLFWRSHWNLPSPNQAFEMLHRGYLPDTDALRSLLKSADYAPGYIDGLIGIAYSPYTRVDARRMWSLGVLDDAGYLQAMRDIGYDDEHAENLLRFVKADDMEATKDLTQAQMIKAYKAGLSPKADVVAYLMKLGYDEEESALIIGLEDAKVRNEQTDDTIDLLDWYYVRGEVSDEQYLSEINSMGIPLLKAKMHLAKAQNKAEKSAKLPTKADTEKWYKKGRISEAEAYSYLMRMGYQETERRLYLDEWEEEMLTQGNEA